MRIIVPRRLSRWLLVPALAALASPQAEREHGRFMLYNSCASLGVTVEALPGGSPLTDITLPQLEAMAQGRLLADGLYDGEAPTQLRIGVSRYAVQLSYMKPVIDAASNEQETIATFSRVAAVTDGQAASMMLELSKLLNVFLSSYRRVNLLDCGESDDTGPPRLRRAVRPPPNRAPRGRPPPQGGGGVTFGRSWPVPENESTVHRASNEVSSPQLLSKVEPDYSAEAKRLGVEGLVMLSLEVWEDGRPHNIRVSKSLGHGLDEKAIEAVEQWRFSPGTKSGKAVRVQVQIEVSFRMIGDPVRRR